MNLSYDYQVENLKEYYLQNGYVIIRGLLPHSKIDNFISIYNSQIVATNTKFYRQNTNVYDKNRFTDAGHVIQSFLDIHNYNRFPEFKEVALDIFFSIELLSALQKITGSKSHNLMQTMLFDANAATPAHQDWWYLDSVPKGNLLGAWIALEDIHEDAGRFYVIPGTHNTNLHLPNMPHSVWLARMKEFVTNNSDKLTIPALKKGDVLFWNSGTIHGSTPTLDPKYSRKSLTGHFMPSEMTFGNLFTSKPWVTYQEYDGNKYFVNQPEYSLKADVISKIKVAMYDNPKLMMLVRKLQNRSISKY